MGQRGPKPKHDWESIKAAYATGQYTTDELGSIFQCSAGLIRQHSMREGWKELRKIHINPLKRAITAQIQSNRGAGEQDNVQSATSNSSNMQKTGNKLAKCESNNRVIVPAEERIKDIVPKGPTFRERVAKQTDKVLDHLESQEIATNLQADQFVSILEKTEKVGARARGLDSETSGSSRILVNLNVLQIPDAVPVKVTRDIEAGQLPIETV